MRKNVSLLKLVFILTFMVSCSQQQKMADYSLSKKEKQKIIRILERIPFNEQNEEIKNRGSLWLKVKSSELQQIKGTYYLISKYHNSERVSRTLLTTEKDKKSLLYGGITCTTTACSESDGCLPIKNSLKCKPCAVNCTRTVSF